MSFAEQEQAVDELARALIKNGYEWRLAITLPKTLQPRLLAVVEDGNIWQRTRAAHFLDGLVREQLIDALLDEMENRAPNRQPSFLDDLAPAMTETLLQRAHTLATKYLAEPAWDRLLDWSGNQAREEAISTLAAFWPVAKLVGGTELVDDLFLSANRVLRWWP